MEKIITEFHGHSGSKVFLMCNDQNEKFIRKINSVDRNLERLIQLQNQNFPVPKILGYYDNSIDIEYIPGTLMSNYILDNNPDSFIDFSISMLDMFSQTSKNKNYRDSLSKVLLWVDYETVFPFNKTDLIDLIPNSLPCSEYHGDFTLDNIIVNQDKFYFIDPVTTPYDSYIFDVAKLRQDLQSKWFLRNSSANIDLKLFEIESTLLTRFPEASNNVFLILMLLRIYLHTQPNDSNRLFLIKEINRLWI